MQASAPTITPTPITRTTCENMSNNWTNHKVELLISAAVTGVTTYGAVTIDLLVTPVGWVVAAATVSIVALAYFIVVLFRSEAPELVKKHKISLETPTPLAPKEPASTPLVTPPKAPETKPINSAEPNKIEVPLVVTEAPKLNPPANLKQEAPPSPAPNKAPADEKTAINTPPVIPRPLPAPIIVPIEEPPVIVAPVVIVPAPAVIVPPAVIDEPLPLPIAAAPAAPLPLPVAAAVIAAPLPPPIPAPIPVVRAAVIAAPLVPPAALPVIADPLAEEAEPEVIIPAGRAPLAVQVRALAIEEEEEEEPVAEIIAAEEAVKITPPTPANKGVSLTNSVAIPLISYPLKHPYVCGTLALGAIGTIASYYWGIHSLFNSNQSQNNLSP